MKSFDESSGLGVGNREQRLPLPVVESRRSKHRGRNRQPIGGEDLEQAQRERKRGNGASGCGAQIFVDIGPGAADFVEGASDGRAGAIRTGACDQVHQLTPAYRRIVAVAGRLAQHSQQAIVVTHSTFKSFRRTVDRL